MTQNTSQSEMTPEQRVVEAAKKWRESRYPEWKSPGTYERALAEAVDALNAKPPESGDERWKGFRVWKSKRSSLHCVDDGTREWAKYLDIPQDHWIIQRSRIAKSAYISDYIELHGDERLPVLQSWQDGDERGGNVVEEKHAK